MGQERLPTVPHAATEAEELSAQAISTGECVGAITHALKGLLNGLDGGVYLMESGFKKENRERVGQGLEMVKRNGARLRNMVGSVLYYVKDRTMDPQPTDLREAVSAALRAVSFSAEQAGVALHAEAGEGAVHADPTALGALLVDLLEQAIDACAAAAPEAQKSVRLAGRVERGGLRLEVSHNGQALNGENRARVLSPHYVTRGSDRSVLWAFAAHRVALMHGGRFELEEGPEGETLFRVVLPGNEGGLP